jgi:septal ring factor EnvC (AmiA/AmiB activator)
MSKKVLIAALAVVVALVVVKGTWVGSHFRVWRQNIRQAVTERVSPEHEIARLRMELNGLGQQDDKHYDKVARQIVAVEKIEQQVVKTKEDLTAREARIRAMKTSMTGEDAFVTFNGSRYSRSDMQAQLYLSAQSFQADEETLKSKEEQLAAMKQSLEINKKKLSELKLVRQQMATELQRLETSLASERQAQAQQHNTLDDANYIRLRRDMDAVKERIKIEKTKRELRGDANNGPVRANEERRENDARIGAYINDRFGNSKAAEKQ